MALALDEVEKFFGAAFEPPDLSVSEWRELFCFDGLLHWWVVYDPERQFFHIAADIPPCPTSQPVVEVEIYCSKISISEPIGGGGSMLALHPCGCENSMNWLCITKTAGGRFSLSTTVGNDPREALGA